MSHFGHIFFKLAHNILKKTGAPQGFWGSGENVNHKVIIGGDMNEDLTSSVSSQRMRFLQEFISEHKLHMKLTKPTFVNSKGVEVSTID